MAACAQEDFSRTGEMKAVSRDVGKKLTSPQELDSMIPVGPLSDSALLLG